MPQAIEASRWTAVEQLQRRVFSTPNPFYCAVAEHAIGLVLSPDRPTKSFLARNAFVDARKVIAARERRRRMREMVPQSVRGGSGPQLEPEHLVPNDGSAEERALLWTDAYRKLRYAVALRHHMAAACLDLWREGRDEQEAADQLGMSLGSVKKLKRLIRDTAAALLPLGYRT